MLTVDLLLSLVVSDVLVLVVCCPFMYFDQIFAAKAGHEFAHLAHGPSGVGSKCAVTI